MRDFLFRTFARLFAVLGCSTLVTACYGVPYEAYETKVSGRVTDERTGEPVKGIQVRMTVGSRAVGGDNSVHTLLPFDQSVDSRTDGDGCFFTEIEVHIEPDGVLVECFDVDGEANGSYLPKSEVFSLEEVESADIRLERTRY